MIDSLPERTGTALFWRAVHIGGVKIVFLIRTLVLARLLAPDDFGLLAIAMIGVGALTRLTNLGMLPALVQQANVHTPHYHVAWTTGIFRAVAISAIVILAAPLIALLFDEPRATDLIRVFALHPIFEAAASIKVAELTRHLRFRSIAFLRLSETLVNTLFSIALVGGLGVWALIAGSLLGSASYAVLSYIVAPYRPRLSFNVSAARPLIQYGRWILLISVTSVAGGFLLQLILARQLGAAALGLYFLATKLAFLPGDLAREAVGAVAFPLYARLQANHYQLARAYRSILIGMSALLVPACVLLVALASSVVENALGPQWAGSAGLIQLLTLATILSLFEETVEPMLRGIGQPHKVFVLELIQSFLVVALIWGLADRHGIVGAGWAWLLTVAACQVVSVIFLSSVVPRPLDGLGKPLLLLGVASLAGGSVAVTLDSLLAGLPGLAISGLSGGLVIVILLFIFDQRFAIGLRANLSLAFPRAAALVPFAFTHR